MAALPNDAQVHALLEAADRASHDGRADESDAMLTQACALSPQHPSVLNARAMRAFKQGDAKQARELLQQTVVIDATQPLLWLNLALTCRALRDAEQELAALNKALALDAYFFLALLQKATLLERRGKTRQAASVFRAFLACVPPHAQQPLPLQAAVVHAQKAVAANDQTLQRHLNERLAQSANEPSQRFAQCMDVLLGKAKVYTQQPTFMHFPQLPAIQFYERSDFPWLDAVEAAADRIREELLNLLRHDREAFLPYVAHAEGAPLNQWRELNHSRRWGAFHLWRDGRRVEAHLARCPATAAVLEQVPRVRVHGQAPNAFFSLLEPHTHIPPHTGVTNTRLVVHLPLVVPDGCRFRVGSETRTWQAGRAWVFDDTIEHEAWNDSAEPRAILIFDIWNPYLTTQEREQVRIVTEAFGEFYQGEPPYSAGL